ncbi:hypothetical protein BaRGS_00026592 [Batillaria attramentaria]|uniref:Uncharacterized protein n=1 Tax=Batillaria attramentaria TaxID=370345 RepID=A0ABD0JLU4_9CAEN
MRDTNTRIFSNVSQVDAEVAHFASRLQGCYKDTEDGFVTANQKTERHIPLRRETVLIPTEVDTASRPPQRVR